MELLSSMTSGESPRPTLWWWPQRSWRNMSLFSRWEKKRLFFYRWQNFWIVSKIGFRQKNSIISKSNVSTLTLDDPMYYLWRAGTIFFQFMQKKEKNHMSKNWLPKGTFLSVSSCLNVFSLSGRLPNGQHGLDWDVFHALHQHAQNCLKIHFFALKINLTPSIAERPQIQNYTTSWQKYFQKHTIQSCKISQIYVTVWEFGVKA